MNEQEDNKQLRKLALELDQLEAKVQAEIPIEESLALLLAFTLAKQTGTKDSTGNGQPL
jgi:hypothetical protein